MSFTDVMLQGSTIDSGCARAKKKYVVPPTLRFINSNIILFQIAQLQRQLDTAKADADVTPPVLTCASAAPDSRHAVRPQPAAARSIARANA